MASDNLDYGYTGDQIHDESLEESQLTYLTGDSQLYSKGINLSNIQQSQQQAGPGKFERFYRSVFVAVERRPTDPNVEKEELFFVVESIYNEVMELSAYSADFHTLGRYLKQLYSLAPDVFQVCVTILTNPSSELPTSLVKYVQEVRQAIQPGTEMNMPIHSYLEKELIDHNLNDDKSDEMRQDLMELQEAVNAGNVRPVRKLLDELLNELPDMKQPLRNWLVESTEVPPTIKVFARKYLT